jgi:hypothetical protein
MNGSGTILEDGNAVGWRVLHKKGEEPSSPTGWWLVFYNVELQKMQ